MCNDINQIDYNVGNDEQLQFYYQLDSLMSQRGFTSTARNVARGTWNIHGTRNISCFAL
ncbi:5045_t:CDS:2 [Diversispora eburnea]|uniref:5045_t:CDS:1 n=1 Tax=Diversispora eburnea TaxID=1213867 RepID=A0A9N9BKP2_9GLOM|nr:5045_t:CDS:2 [Diversispora eburnea]